MSTGDQIVAVRIETVANQAGSRTLFDRWRGAHHARSHLCPCGLSGHWPYGQEKTTAQSEPCWQGTCRYAWPQTDTKFRPVRRHGNPAYGLWLQPIRRNNATPRDTPLQDAARPDYTSSKLFVDEVAGDSGSGKVPLESNRGATQLLSLAILLASSVRALS